MYGNDSSIILDRESRVWYTTISKLLAFSAFHEFTCAMGIFAVISKTKYIQNTTKKFEWRGWTSG